MKGVPKISEMNPVKHEIAPVYAKYSRILILGSFPSVKSRENNFFYGHPQNRFWKVLSALYDYPLPQSIAEKKALLLNNQIAVWDVIASCEITGSSDSSIKNVVPADLALITDSSPIEKIFTNGGTADKLYRKYCQDQTHIEAIKLPSTSPANAAWTFEKLLTEWEKIKM